MDFVCDFHVKKVLEFMQDNLPCDKLVGIAEGIAQIAPIIWGRYERTPVRATDIFPLVFGNSGPHSTLDWGV